MKRVVFLDDLKEADIRPQDLYNEYKRLLEQDIKKYFSDASLLKAIDCPGCCDDKSEFLLHKMGFDYRVCSRCGSIFVSPRPTDKARRSFYKNSDAGVFLRKNFLGNTLESRSEKIISYCQIFVD